MRSLHLLKLETVKAVVGAYTSLLEDCDIYTYSYNVYIYTHLFMSTSQSGLRQCFAMLKNNQKDTVHNMFITWSWHIQIHWPGDLDLQGQHVLRHFCYPPGSANSKVGLPFRLVNVISCGPFEFWKDQFVNSCGVAMGFFQCGLFSNIQSPRKPLIGIAYNY